MEMKDVAGKLKGWQDIELKPQTSIKDLIDLQLSLQIFYHNNYNGKDGKYFPNYTEVKNWTQESKVHWTKQNLLRIFDQIAEYNVWFDYWIQEGLEDPSHKINRLFELIDALHFLFNIISIWDAKQNIKHLQTYPQYASHDVMFSTMKLAVISSQMLNTIPWKHWKTPTVPDTGTLKRFANKFIQQVDNIFISLKMKRSDIYRMYFAKNQQNINRQKANY